MDKAAGHLISFHFLTDLGLKMQCSELSHYIIANDYGYNYINSIRDLTNTELVLDSHSFSQIHSARWIDYDNQGKALLSNDP